MLFQLYPHNFTILQPNKKFMSVKIRLLSQKKFKVLKTHFLTKKCCEEKKTFTFSKCHIIGLDIGSLVFIVFVENMKTEGGHTQFFLPPTKGSGNESRSYALFLEKALPWLSSKSQKKSSRNVVFTSSSHIY
jgi:hypothetical protein